MEKQSGYRFTAGDFVWLVLYVCLLATVAWGMLRTRAYALADFSTPAAQQSWDEWREAVKRGKSETSPVQRKTPKSVQPPTLVLLRDHFPVCLTAAVVMSSLLFASLMFLIRGVLASPAFIPREDKRA